MKHAVIYVFGLGDHRGRGQELAVRLWRLQGVESSVFRMHWLEPGGFEDKVQALLARIDMLTAQDYTVSLVGTSAGASVVINVYALRQNIIHRVVCICGKLRNAQTVSQTTFSNNPAFAESLQTLPDSLAALTAERLSKVRSVRPLADNLVPPKDTVIDGVESYLIPGVGHAFSIGLAISVFSPTVLNFIKRP